MTVRHVRFEIPCLGHNWHDVADLDDTDPLIAALLAASRLTVVPGTPGPAQSYHPTAVLYSATAPDVTGLAANTVWVSPAGFALLEGGAWAPLAGGGGAGAQGPAGPKGDTGATGARGPAGTDATVTDAAVAAVYGAATGAKITADPLVKASFVPFWAPAEAVTAGAVRVDPTGHLITRNATGTTRSSYDAAEQSGWTVTSSAGGGGGAITSVNGKTGVVTLAAADVGAVGQSGTGVPDPAAVYEPVFRPVAPRPQPAAILSEFQAGHGFTATAGTLTDDTALSVKGTQSVQYVSDGTGTYANITSPALAAFDLTGKVLRLTYRVEDMTKLGGLQCTVGTDTTFANGWWWGVQGGNSASQNIAYSGEWATVTLSFHDATKYGAGAKTGLTAFRFQVKDTGAPVTLHFQVAETIPDGTATFPNGAVVICADDGYDSFMKLGKTYCDSYGYPVTLYPIVDMLGKAGRTTLAALRDAQNTSGAEVGAHSFLDANHALTFTGQTAAGLDADLRQQKAWLIANGFRGSSHVAHPKGQDGVTTDGVSVASIVGRYFASARSTVNKTKETWPPANPLRMRAISSIGAGPGGYLASKLTAAGGDLDLCKATGSVLFLTFHEVVADGTESTANQCGMTDFRSVIDGVRSRGIPVVTVGELLRTPLATAATGGAVVEAVNLPKQLGTVGATGAAATVSAWDHVHPRAFWTPADHGLVTWTHDPVALASSSVAASGTMQLARVHVPVATTVTNVLLYVSTAGATLTAGQSFAALYTAGGALVAATADQSAAWASTGLKTMPLTSAQAVAAGDYYVAFWSVGTTPPAFLRGNGNTIVNVGLSSSSTRFGTADTGLTTAAPATMGAKTSAAISWWAALS